MRSASTAIRAAYFSLLQGMVIDGSTDVGVYDSKAPDYAKPPYIIMGPQQPIRDNTKDTFGTQEYITLSAVTKHPAGKFSRVLAEKVVDEILKRALPAPGAVGIGQPEGFNVYMAVLDSGNETELTSGTETVYQKIITIRHLVEQQAT